MRSSVTLLALALSATTAWAGAIEGKWGLGVDSGVFRSDGVHGALIFGRSARTAWLLDVKAEENVRDVDGFEGGIYLPGIASAEFSQSVVVEIGPRFRRFTRPEADWSPYWDLFAAATHANTRYSTPVSSNDRFSTGGVLGLGLGVEYFTPWHFSVAAHSDVLEARYARIRARTNSQNFFLGSSSGTGYQHSVNAGLSPAIELRAYF